MSILIQATIPAEEFALADIIDLIKRAASNHLWRGLRRKMNGGIESLLEKLFIRCIERKVS